MAAFGPGHWFGSPTHRHERGDAAVARDACAVGVHRRGDAATAAAAALVVPRLGLAVPAEVPDEAAIRAMVESADVPTVLQAWGGLKDAGVDRGAMPEEVRARQMAGVAGWIGGLLWAVSGLGGLIAIAGGIVCLASPSPPSRPRP